MVDFSFKMVGFTFQMVDFNFKTVDFSFKMVDFRLKMVDFGFKMLNFSFKTNKILFASGPPGTGKTHVVHEQIRQWKSKGARILFTLPTGQLASEVRSVHPDIDVDTSHGAFLLLRPLQEAMAILTQYELVIIDEARGWVKFSMTINICVLFFCNTTTS